MTTTIRNFEDLLRLLDDNPEYVEGLRARLLTAELLDLPAKVERLVAAQDELSATVARLVESHDEFRAEVAEFVRATDRRLDALERRLGNLHDDFRHFRSNYAENGLRNKHMGAIFLFSRAKGLRLDIATLEMLAGDEIARLLAGADMSGIDEDELKSFLDTDLVVRCRNLDGEVCYVVAEASYTCDLRDTRRAALHADMVRRFTGNAAYPMIAGVRKDLRIERDADAASIYCYAMDEDDLRP